MASICFFIDIEKGHLLPTLGIALSLSEKGHQVAYIGIEDHRDTVIKYGLAYYTVFQNIYPAGCLHAARKALRQHQKVSNQGKPHLCAILEGELNEVLSSCKPDLLVISSFLAIEAVVLQHLYRTKVLLFTPYLPDAKNSDTCLDQMLHLTSSQAGKLLQFLSSKQHKKVNTLKDLFLPVDSLPELIACPPELKESGIEIRENARYIEASIRPPLPGVADHLFDKIPQGKNMVYVSMGSQTTLFPEKVQNCINLLIDTIRVGNFNDSVFIISTGPDYHYTNGDLPENIQICEWVPQVEVLQRARMAIIHGGLGAIKECIHYGVPMIVYPIMRDGPANAQRISMHGLGIAVDFEQMNREQLIEKMHFVLHNDEIRKNILKFKNIFRGYQNRECGAAEIENILATA